MDDEQIKSYFQQIRQRIAVLQGSDAAAWEEIERSLAELQLIYEQMHTSLEAAELVEEELLQQNQQVATGYYHYHDLFHAAPIAYLVTNGDGVILEANQAIAQLLNLPQRYLTGKPLIIYVDSGDRLNFLTHLSQLSTANGVQVWQLALCPRNGESFTTEWHIQVVRNDSGWIESLRIGIYNLSPSQWLSASSQGRSNLPTMPSSSLSFENLQVLVVDDEADARNFIVTVLEAHRIRVRAVASAAAALKELEQSHPDVLLADLRMPEMDGYQLIRQIRTFERERGGHLPTAAITAYLDEDREKALSAGFEAYLHKQAQPSEWLELVTRLAGLPLHSPN